MKKTITLLKLIPILVAIIFFNRCQQQNKLPTGEGFINVDGGNVWYRVTGSGDKTPILVLHGGPGVPSYYLKPLSALGGIVPFLVDFCLATFRGVDPV